MRQSLHELLEDFSEKKARYWRHLDLHENGLNFARQEILIHSNYCKQCQYLDYIIWHVFDAPLPVHDLDGVTVSTSFVEPTVEMQMRSDMTMASLPDGILFRIESFYCCSACNQKWITVWFFLTDTNENLISPKQKKISRFWKKPFIAFALQILHLEKNNTSLLKK